MFFPLALSILFFAGCSGGSEGEGPASVPVSQTPEQNLDTTLELLAPASDFAITASNSSQSIPVRVRCLLDNEVIIFNNELVTLEQTCIDQRVFFAVQSSSFEEGNGLSTIKYANYPDSISFRLVKDTNPPGLELVNLVPVGQANASSYPVSGSCTEEGAAIVIDADTTNAQSVCQNSSFSASLDLSQAAGPSVTIQAFAIDDVGNQSSVQSEVVAFDVDAPSVSFNQLGPISSANQNSYPISGLCSENEAAVTITIGEIQEEVLCSASVFSAVFNVSALPDGPALQVRALHQDPIGNSSTAETHVIKDTTSASLTISSPMIVSAANASSYSLSGTCSEEGRSVSGTLSTIPIQSSCTGGSWFIGPINLSFFADGSYGVTLSHQDALLNPAAEESTTVTKDTSVVVPVLSYLTPSSPSGNIGSATFEVTEIETGDIVRFYSGGQCGELLETTTSTGASVEITTSTTEEGNYLFSYEVEDAVSGTTGCLGPYPFKEDKTAPEIPSELTLSSPEDGVTSSDATPVISGTVPASEEKTVVRAYFNSSDCSAPPIGEASISSSSFSLEGLLPFDGSAQGLNHFWIKLVDEAGNESSCFDTGLSYILQGGGLASLPKLAMVGSNSPTFVISLEDSNEIKHINTAGEETILGTFQNGELVPSFQVNQGDRIESTGACYAVTQGHGTAPWASPAYAGTILSTYISRYGQYAPKIYVAAISKTSFVTLEQNGSVVDFASIPAGEIHEFTLNLTNNLSLLIRGSEKVNAYFVARNSNSGSYTYDARVLTPSSTDIIGQAGYLTGTESNTSANAYFQDATEQLNLSLDEIENHYLARSNRGQERYAVRVIADRPVALTQIADYNGINASPSLPVSMLSTHYGIARQADYVTFAALESATVTVILPNGSETTYNMTRNSGAGANAPWAFRYLPSGNVPRGTRFICSSPCYAMYDDEDTGSDRDETLMMGYSPGN